MQPQLNIKMNIVLNSKTSKSLFWIYRGIRIPTIDPRKRNGSPPLPDFTEALGFSMLSGSTDFPSLETHEKVGPLIHRYFDLVQNKIKMMVHGEKSRCMHYFSKRTTETKEKDAEPLARFNQNRTLGLYFREVLNLWRKEVLRTGMRSPKKLKVSSCCKVKITMRKREGDTHCQGKRRCKSLLPTIKNYVKLPNLFIHFCPARYI